MDAMIEKNGITYQLVGDYYLPCVRLPEGDHSLSVGRYGRMRLRYLKEHHRTLLNTLLTHGKLSEHLKEVEAAANEQVNAIVAKMAEADGTDEELKMRDQLRWVGLMNNYQHCAEEIVLKELIYN